MSWSIASIARRLMSAGAGKSGKPCERFTAPCFNASRVISRITDSVNELAFFETYLLFEGDAVLIAVHLTTEYTDSRNDLLAGGFTFQLREDRADRRGVAAVWR